MQNAIKHVLTAIAGIVISIPSMATCWEVASQSYGIPVDVLKAIAKTESNFNHKALNKNSNGSYDIGLMQINSTWLPKLETYGITEASLHDACVNLKVGAWILSNNAKKLGWNWSAIGAYNVGCARLDAIECGRRRNKYAWKVHAALRKVSDTKTPMLAGYEQSNMSHGIAIETKKIMVIQLAGNESLIKLANVGDQGPQGLNVDSFMSYEGQSDD